MGGSIYGQWPNHHFLLCECCGAMAATLGWHSLKDREDQDMTTHFGLVGLAALFVTGIAQSAPIEFKETGRAGWHRGSGH